MQAIAIDADVVLIVDDVVVAQIADGADLVPDIDRGEIDDRGLIVVSDSPSVDTEAAAPPVRADNHTEAPLKVSAAGDPIPRIALEELPIEAIETLILIYQGGPFPFERDGATFGNFEERLPAADAGYYREYTVITPGSDDRGARRIVTGNNDTEFYYTDDHYETFVEVVISEEDARP
jgi:ribonuclease T1